MLAVQAAAPAPGPMAAESRPTLNRIRIDLQTAWRTSFATAAALRRVRHTPRAGCVLRGRSRGGECRTPRGYRPAHGSPHPSAARITKDNLHRGHGENNSRSLQTFQIRAHFRAGPVLRADVLAADDALAVDEIGLRPHIGVVEPAAFWAGSRTVIRSSDEAR